MSAENVNIKTDLDSIYHEKQTRQLCALHALNNLFQDEHAFSKIDLDKIAESLLPSFSFFNPHKSSIGLGNYDINVILIALQQKKFEAIWFNKKKDVKCLNLDNIYGFILNIQNLYNFWKNLATFFTSSKRHWISVKKIGSFYYNLDSKLRQPVLIGNDEKVLEFLQKSLIENDAEIFIVVKKDIAQSNCWLKCD